VVVTPAGSFAVPVVVVMSEKESGGGASEDTKWM
jgi:hypothetical protein